MLDVAIIGAGLSGMALAERLSESARNLAIFEARERCGGRILSMTLANGVSADLGPTWLWPKQQPRITALCRRLNLPLFRQADAGLSFYQAHHEAAAIGYHDTQTHADAFRIQGGCHRLIEALLVRLNGVPMHLGWQLDAVSDRGSHVELAFSVAGVRQIVTAKQVVLTLPPRLLAERVIFAPTFSAELMAICRATPTWMASHSKAAIGYSRPFWRQHGWSGNAMASYPGALLSEVYDACDPAVEAAAQFGFFGIPATLRDQYHQQLPALILNQLSSLFGHEALAATDLTIQDWSREVHTATADDYLPPNGHPDYGHRWLQLDHWTDKLYFGGTETAAEQGGYMEGALVAAERIHAALGHGSLEHSEPHS